MKKLLLVLLLIPSLVFAEKPPFSGVADTETVSASTSSAGFSLGADTPQVLFTVSDDVEAFITCSSSAPTATIASAKFHMQKGTRVFSKPHTHTACAVILASGTATLYATPGFGE